MPQFGKKPRKKKFSPPPQTRGGWKGFINKNVERPLSGMVQNLKAAQGEERFARTLEKAKMQGLVTNYEFRMSPGQAKQTPGWLELDYFIETPGRAIAISVKGFSFVHKNTQAKDALNELMILTRLRKMGYSVQKVETVYDYELSTQEGADKIAKKFGVYK